MLRARRLWPAVSAFWAIAVLISVLLDVGAPIQPLLVVPFLLACPGTALVRLLSLEERLPELVLGVAVSVAMDGCVAGAMVYAAAWSPTAGLGVLVGVTLAGNLVEIVRKPLGAPVRALP